MKSNIKSIIFDFDGVLVDSVDIKTNAFAELYKGYGKEIVAKIIEHHQQNGGMNRVGKFYHYHQSFLGKALSKNELNSLCNRFSDIVANKVTAASEIPGVTKFLESIYNSSILCFIVSATPFMEVNNIVRQRGWAKYFQKICGAPTSKEEHLKKVIKEFSFLPKDSLYFGDALSDYQAAKECNVPFIGIIPGNDATLLRIVPDIVWYKDFLEVQRMFKEQAIFFDSNI